MRIALHDIAKVRRLRGSPVLMVERTTVGGLQEDGVLLRAAPAARRAPRGPVERSAGFDRFRAPSARRGGTTSGYLGLMNRQKKSALTEWVRAVKDAVSKAASGPDQAAAQG